MPMNFPFLFYLFYSFKLGKGKKVRDLKPTGGRDGRSCQDPRHHCALNAPTGAVTRPLSRVATCTTPKLLLLVFGKTISAPGFPLGLGVLMLGRAAEQNLQ